MSVQQTANSYLSQIDKEVSSLARMSRLKGRLVTCEPEVYFGYHKHRQMSKYSTITNLERQTSIPKVYMALGVLGTYFAFIFFNIAGQLLTNLAGFVIPTYYSLEALFSVGKSDDTQWLTYWVVFAFLTVIESALNAVYWFPFYYTFKFIFVLWLALPMTSGAQIIFRSFISPVFSKYYSGVGANAAHLRSKIDSTNDKAL